MGRGLARPPQGGGDAAPDCARLCCGRHGAQSVFAPPALPQGCTDCGDDVPQVLEAMQKEEGRIFKFWVQDRCVCASGCAWRVREGRGGGAPGGGVVLFGKYAQMPLLIPPPLPLLQAGPEAGLQPHRPPQRTCTLPHFCIHHKICFVTPSRRCRQGQKPDYNHTHPSTLHICDVIHLRYAPFAPCCAAGRATSWTTTTSPRSSTRWGWAWDSRPSRSRRRSRRCWRAPSSEGSSGNHAVLVCGARASDLPGHAAAAGGAGGSKAVMPAAAVLVAACATW